MFEVETFRKYYSSNLFRERIESIFPIFKFHFKVIKFRLPSGAYLQLHKISTVGQLIRCFINFVPQDAWFSASDFMSPQIVVKKRFSRKGSKIMQHSFLQSSLPLDFDNQQYNRRTKKYFSYDPFPEVEKSVAFLRKKFKNLYFVRTDRGYQLHILDFYDIQCKKTRQIEMPMERENALKMDKIKILNQMRKKGIKFDFEVNKDNWRVFRIPYSLHHSGTICMASADLNKIILRKNVSSLYASDAKADDKRQSDYQKLPMEVTHRTLKQSISTVNGVSTSNIEPSIEKATIKLSRCSLNRSREKASSGRFSFFKGE